jgi:myo-inositol-1(or 4)-monophosphatase
VECQELLELLLAAARRVDEAIKPLACQYAATPDPSHQAADAADALAESAALNVLLSADVRVLSEEAGWLGQGSALVILDPIDGTDNLIRGIPFSGPSIWARTKQGVCAAVVTNVFTGHTFWATSGSGAFRDGQRLSVAKSRVPDVMIVGGEYQPLHGLFGRDLGATAHSLCAVAEGRLAGYRTPAHCPDRSWDLMAGLVIAGEAGCVLGSVDGGQDPMDDPLSDNWVVVAPEMAFARLASRPL